MSNTKTSIGGLSQAVEKVLKDYTGEIADGVKKAAKQTGRDAVNKLKQGGSYQGGLDSGYNQGWRSKVTERDFDIEVTVHNAKAPGLTHLLEKGHAKVNGGRTRAFPHIEPAEREAVDEFKNRVERVIHNA